LVRIQYLFQQFPSAGGDHDIDEASVFGVRGLSHHAFFDEPVYDTAGIAHLIQHTLPDLQGGERFTFAPEDPQDVELAGGDIPLIKNDRDLFGEPVIRVEYVEYRLLVFVPELSLIYLVFKCHVSKLFY